MLSTLEGPNPENVRVWSKHVNYAYLSEAENSVGSLKEGATMAATEPTPVGASFLGHSGRRRYARQTPEEVVGGPCEPFVIGDEEQKMFFSPGHPENYPNKTDCFKVLSGECIYMTLFDQHLGTFLLKLPIRKYRNLHLGKNKFVQFLSEFAFAQMFSFSQNKSGCELYTISK